MSFGSRMQEDSAYLHEMNKPPCGHTVDTCRCGAVIRQCRCIGPHTPRVVQQSCPKCVPTPSAVTPSGGFGSRRTTVELSVADLRRIVGAPDDARVELSPERDHGPNGTTEARISISWSVKP